MAQELVVRVWCDVHQSRGENVEALFSETVAIGDWRRHIDLCVVCQAEIIGDLPDTLARYGVEPEAPRKRQTLKTTPASERLLCPLCQKPFLNRSSLSGHTREIHGEPLSSIEARFDLPKIGGKAKVLVCDVPGCTSGDNGGPKVVTGAQGMGAHKKRTHGIDGTSAAAVYYRNSKQTADETVQPDWDVAHSVPVDA